MRLFTALVSCLIFSGLAQGEGLEQVSCWFGEPEEWPEHRCYMMEVPQDHSNPNGPTVKFPVLYVDSPSPVQGQVPVVHTGGGGPGYAMGLAEADSVEWTISNYFELSIARGRDLILLDPRGVGLAEPKLDCPETEQLLWQNLGKDIDDDTIKALYLEESLKCKKRLEASGLNLANFDSLAVARDIELLRKALKIRRWNIYGISYGTRYALTVAREYPESVRALVLDSAVFNNVRYTEEEIADTWKAFDRMLSYCGELDTCGLPYKEGKALLFKLYYELEENPLAFTVTHPETYKPQDILFDGDFMLDILFSNIYWEDFYYGLGELLKSLEHRNPDIIAPYVREELMSIVSQSFSPALMTATYCREEHPFVNYKKALKKQNKYDGIGKWTAWYIEYNQQDCANWNLPPSKAIEGEAISTAIPSLFLHGDLDPVLPVRDLERQIKHFANSQYLIYPDVAHDVVGSSECAELEAADFLDDPVYVLAEDTLGEAC